MSEPVVYVAYAPGGAGLLHVGFYFARLEHIYGWYTGNRAVELLSEFFMLENFYSWRAILYYRSKQDDIYGDWVQQMPEATVAVDRPVPVPDNICHELDRLQSGFTQEWLFYPDDPRSADDVAAYHSQELRLQPVNIRSRKLNKLDNRDSLWSYVSPGADLNVIDFLMQRWPLDGQFAVRA
jgi:hypothetical protein